MSEQRIESTIAIAVFLALWLNGSFYPLILLPLAFTRLYCRRSLSHIGLGGSNLRLSITYGVLAGMLVLAAYYPVHLLYAGKRALQDLSAGAILIDVGWYPIYEELAYRGFFLGFFADGGSSLAGSGIWMNLMQALLFVSVHHHHISAGFHLLLIPVFLMGFLNGMVFLRSRNLAGCILSHSLVNGMAMFLRAVSR